MLGSKARHRRGLLPLFILLLLCSPIQAQTPDVEPSHEYYAANVIPEQGSVSIEYLGSANVELRVDDVSVASSEDMSAREAGTIWFSVDVIGNETAGWTASLSQYMVQTRPGDTHQLSLNIQAGATIDNPTAEVRVQARYDAPAGEETISNASVMAVAESFPRLTMQMDGLPDDFEPDLTRQVGFTVTNNNYYPDMVSFKVSGPEDWMVSPPSSIRLAPGETKTVYVDVKAPENPWFLYTSKSQLLTAEAVSETNGQTLMTVGVPMSQSGVNFPAWAAPHLFLFLMGAGLIAVRTRRKLRDRRLEKGKPSYPGLDPEHEAEFEALKIEDPEKAETLHRRLDTLYDRRKEAWKEAYEQRKRDEETLEQAYQERHEALVAAREGEEHDEAEHLARRRRLLRRKRELLKEKRERLREEGRREDTDPGAPAAPD